MKLFKLKKSSISPEFGSVTSPAILPVQNVYSPYHRLSSPSPPGTIFENSSHKSYEKTGSESIKPRNSYRDKIAFEDVTPKKQHNLYSRLLCCFCFPCLPMWTRTICCFLFLGIFVLVSLIMFFISSFKIPQILFNGGNQQMTSANMDFEYSIHNGNFFELNFENLKVVMYYPTVNKTTIGVGEISNFRLGPQSVTNMTLPVKILGENEKAFENMVIELCKGKEKDVITVNVDMMPTIRLLNGHIMNLSLKEQKTKVSCNKLLQSTVSNRLIDDMIDDDENKSKE